MMTRWHKVFLVVLFSLLACPVLVGCSLTAAPVQSTPADEPEVEVAVTVVAPTAEPAALAPEAAPVAEAPETAPMAVPVARAASLPGSAVQATLTVQVERVEVRRPFESAYSSLRKNQSILVGGGDVIRTGSTGMAKLVFLDKTETTLFPNTVLAIGSFAEGSNGAHSIRLIQLIGNTFNRVNFTNPNSLHEVVTPYGVASVRGTGYWVEVVIKGPLATMLLTQDLEAFEAQVGQAIVSGDLSALVQAILALLGATPGTVSVDVGAGTVTFTDNLGNVVFVNSGITANSGTDSNGNSVIVTTTVIDRFCGDGICDPYLGENAGNCRDC